MLKITMFLVLLLQSSLFSVASTKKDSTKMLVEKIVNALPSLYRVNKYSYDTINAKSIFSIIKSCNYLLKDKCLIGLEILEKGNYLLDIEIYKSKNNRTFKNDSVLLNEFIKNEMKIPSRGCLGNLLSKVNIITCNVKNEKYFIVILNNT